MANQGLESSLVTSLVSPVLEGSISAPKVEEVHGTPSNMIIRSDQDWEIDVNWEVHGSLLSPPASRTFPFTGEWVVRVYIESMGRGPEREIPKDRQGIRVNVIDGISPAGEPDKKEYSTSIKVPKNDLKPGVYKLVLAITHESSPGVPGLIAGFYEGDMLQIYDPAI